MDIIRASSYRPTQGALVESPASFYAGSGLLSHEGTKPGQLALAVYCQLEADVDDVLAAQAVKCLVHLSKEMLQADRAAGLAPAAATSNSPGAASEQAAVMQHHNGSNALEEAELITAARQSDVAGSESDEEDGQQDDRAGAAGLTLQGLIRRMVKFAGDR